MISGRQEYLARRFNVHQRHMCVRRSNDLENTNACTVMRPPSNAINPERVFSLSVSFSLSKSDVKRSVHACIPGRGSTNGWHVRKDVSRELFDFAFAAYYAFASVAQWKHLVARFVHTHLSVMCVNYVDEYTAGHKYYDIWCYFVKIVCSWLLLFSSYFMMNHNHLFISFASYVAYNMKYLTK